MTKLQEYRKRTGITQKFLAEKSGVPLRTLQELDNGRMNINGAAALTVHRLAQTLTVYGDHVTVEDLLEIENK